MKKILVTRKLLKDCEDKAIKTFEAKLNTNDELYSQSKLIGEDLCRSYQRDFNVPYIIFRPFNIYGYGQSNQFVISSIFDQINNGKKKIKIQNPYPKRDFIYIKDVVDSVDVPVVANGDVVDTESAALCLETTGAAGLMIGRGAIGRPSVFGEIKVGLGWMEESELPWVNDEWYELEDIARTFATRRWCWNRYLELARATTGLRPKWMKRHAVAFTKGLPGAKAARSSMHEVSNSEELGDAIMAMLSQ